VDYSSRAERERIAIILCTYNPNLNHITKQLISLENQTVKGYELFIIDDASDHDLFQKINVLVPSIITNKYTIMRNQRNIGFSQNFIQTVNRIKNFKYYSFCDQDDVWHKDKLQKSLERIKNHNLYCSSTSLIDTNDNLIGLNLLNIKASFKNSLVQSIAGGNTYLFDNKVKQLLLKIPKSSIIPSHDWTIYQLAAAHDLNIIYDKSPTLNYRLHDKNTTGTSFGLPANLNRIKLLFSGVFREWNNQNVRILSLYQSSMSTSNQNVLKIFKRDRDGNLIERIRIFTKYLVRRSSFIQNSALLLGLIFKKI
jgi:hypothetical protein